MSEAQIPVVNAGNLYINGLIPSFLSATTIGLSAGQARSSLDVTDIFLNEAVIINTALIGVANGIDTGPITVSTYYSVYVINDSTGYSPTAGLLSLNGTAPLLPSKYDSFRHVGYVFINSSSNILQFYHIGNYNERRFILDTALTTTISLLGNTSYQDFSFVGKIPTAANSNYMIAIVNASFTAVVAGNGAFFRTFSSSSTNGQNYIRCPAVSTMTAQIDLLTELNAGEMKIQWKTTSASDDLTIDVAGFEFTV